MCFILILRMTYRGWELITSGLNTSIFTENLGKERSNIYSTIWKKEVWKYSVVCYREQTQLDRSLLAPEVAVSFLNPLLPTLILLHRLPFSQSFTAPLWSIASFSSPIMSCSHCISGCCGNGGLITGELLWNQKNHRLLCLGV